MMRARQMFGNELGEARGCRSHGLVEKQHRLRRCSWDLSGNQEESMRTYFGSSTLRPYAVALPLLLSISLAASSAAQVVRVADIQAQDSKQSDASAIQSPAVQRVGVDEDRPIALTLFDAVKMALQQNREIEVERINVQEAEYDLFAARGAMDISLGASSFYEHKTVPV